MSYYKDAESGKNIWSGYNPQKSENISDERDAKKNNISITENTTQNIEDRYYGENPNTYSNNKKYFGPDDKNKVLRSGISINVLILIGATVFFLMRKNR